MTSNLKIRAPPLHIVCTTHAKTKLTPTPTTNRRACDDASREHFPCVQPVGGFEHAVPAAVWGRDHDGGIGRGHHLLKPESQHPQVSRV